MRTTIDLPDDLHKLTVSLARSRSRTLSQTISDVSAPLSPGRERAMSSSTTSGLPLVSTNHE
jgi:hypothetical protein